MDQTLNIIALREAISNVTKILADRGIKVTQRGSKAFVRSVNGRPKSVNIPFLPENATRELIDAINGFIDHEVGHLLFTDFDVIHEGSKMGKAIADLHNQCEDPFVEKKMSERFKGSAANLENVGNFYLLKVMQVKFDEALAAGKKSFIQSLLLLPAIRAFAGQPVYKRFMDDKWVHCDGLLRVITPDIREMLENAESTQDSLDAAIAIHKAMTTPKRKPPPEKDEDDEDDDEEEGEDPGELTAPDESESEEDPDDDDDDEDDDEDDEDDDEDESGPGASDEEDDDEDEDEDEDEDDEDEGVAASADATDEDDSDEDESDDEEDDESEGEDSVAGEDEPGAGEEEDESDDEEEAPLMTDKELAEALEEGDFDEAVAEAITEDTRGVIRDSTYNVFTNEDDVIEPFPVDHTYNDEMLESMENQTRQMVGPLQKNLERLVTAQKHSRWNSGLRTGRVNSASLYRLKTGDTRVMRRREVMGETKDVAVSLVLDNSGSMQGSKLDLTMISAYAMSTVLDRLGVAHEVSGFTTIYSGYSTPEEIAEEERKLGMSFSRYEALYLPIYKGFNEKLGVEQKQRMALAPHKHSFTRNNVDGESIAVAATRLLKRPEAGKIMLVLSDGAPAAHGNHDHLNQHLRDTVQKYTNLGVKLIGIGIQDSSVKHFYPEYTVLRNLDDLPGQLMKELRKIIL